MKTFNLVSRVAAVLLLVSLTSPLVSYADSSADQGARFSRDELDEMLAPIALYPDALLSQLLMAATYPLEVVEAARWSDAHSDYSGDDAVREVADKNWDPSVKSLVAFPRILSEMSEKLDWTERLGDAFLDQQDQVMDTVQELRQKAYDAGNLRSSDQINVTQEGQTIVVDATNPDVTYVPYYNPEVVYGPWWGAAPPVYWDPWPGYYYRPGYPDGFAWGVGVTLATGFFFGSFDWGHHYANVEHVNNYYFNGDRYYNHRYGDHHDAPRTWQHDPVHRRGVPYHDAQLRQQYGRSSAAVDEHRNYRGRDVPVVTNFRQGYDRPASGITESSSHAPNEGNHDQGTRGSHFSHAAESVQRENHSPVSSSQNDRPSRQMRPPAFEGMSRGSAAHDDSNRGRNSRQQMISPQRAASPAGRAQPHADQRKN